MSTTRNGVLYRFSRVFLKCSWHKPNKSLRSSDGSSSRYWWCRISRKYVHQLHSSVNHHLQILLRRSSIFHRLIKDIVNGLKLIYMSTKEWHHSHRCVVFERWLGTTENNYYLSNCFITFPGGCDISSGEFVLFWCRLLLFMRVSTCIIFFTRVTMWLYECFCVMYFHFHSNGVQHRHSPIKSRINCLCRYRIIHYRPRRAGLQYRSGFILWHEYPCGRCLFFITYFCSWSDLCTAEDCLSSMAGRTENAR